MTSTLGSASEFPNPEVRPHDAPEEDRDAPPPDADSATALPRASQVVLEAVRAVHAAAESLGAQHADQGDLSPPPADAITLPSALELVRQISRGDAEPAEFIDTPQPGDSSFVGSDLTEPKSGRLANSRRRRRGYWMGAAFAAVGAVIAAAATPSILGAADRQFGLVAIQADPVVSVEAPVAAIKQSDVSSADLLNQAVQLHVTTAALTPATFTNSTEVSDAASTTAAVDSAPPPSKLPISGDEAIRGVSDKEILFGIAAPFSGPTRELGRQMKMGVETAFDQINESGGVNGRRLRLVAVDDGYEPTRTADAMHQLYDKDRVFGFIGNVGTPTAAVALPFALDHRTLFFGAFSGANLLRRDPPDRYVFNFRASYAEETAAVLRYLMKVRRLQPSQIAVFAQQDAFGDSGYDGVSKALRALPGDNAPVVRLNYKRNTVDVQDAATQLGALKGRIKAVIMVASYRAAAKFIEKTRDLYPAMIYTNVSFVGSTALADELMLLGPRYASGVVVTQVTPAVNSYASVILKYKSALADYFPGESPDYVSLEGYIDGMILAETIRRAGPQIDTEKLVDELERLRNFDMGLGTLVTFTPDEHQGSHKVWGTELDDAGRYQPIDLQ